MVARGGRSVNRGRVLAAVGGAAAEMGAAADRGAPPDGEPPPPAAGSRRPPARGNRRRRRTGLERRRPPVGETRRRLRMEAATGGSAAAVRAKAAAAAAGAPPLYPWNAPLLGGGVNAWGAGANARIDCGWYAGRAGCANGRARGRLVPGVRRERQVAAGRRVAGEVGRRAAVNGRAVRRRRARSTAERRDGAFTGRANDCPDDIGRPPPYGAAWPKLPRDDETGVPARQPCVSGSCCASGPRTHGRA